MGCYNHALHNTVCDGLEAASKRMEKALGKIQYFANFAHKSGAFSEALEKSYGQEITLKTEVKTRWNYQYLAANHFMSLDPQHFDHALAEHGCKKLQTNRLTSIDRECTTQCCDALGNFYEATIKNEWIHGDCHHLNDNVVLSMLFELYLKVLCVVASGSPVERVFSVAGNLFRPRRSRMSAKVLSTLVFMKCNIDILSSVL